MQSRHLSDISILVVEDEPFIAFDIMDAVEMAGARAVGPAGTVKAALDLLARESVHGAILDVNLHDGDVGPVIEALSARTLPFIIHTGAGLTESLRQQFPSLDVFHKPTMPDVLVAAICGKIET